jgi:regulator of replication initiation timing
MRHICILLFLAASLLGQNQPKHHPRSRMQPPQVSEAQPAFPKALPVFPPGTGPQQDVLFFLRHKVLHPVADIGTWIEERRARLVSVTIADRLWWYSLTMTGSVIVLLWIVYVLQVSEARKLWKAAGVLADIWNWAIYTEDRAKTAIAEYNRHIEACTRLAEIELSGKPLPSEQARTAKEAIDPARTQNELDLVTKENRKLKEQLANQESEIAQFHKRIAELSAQISQKEGGSPAMPPSRLNAELTARINQLTMENEELKRQLMQEQRKNEPKTALSRGWPGAAGNGGGNR